MDQLFQTAIQSVTDLSQRVGFRQLAEQHRHTLCPTAKPFRVSFGLVFPNCCLEFRSGEMLQHLIKQACYRYHLSALRWSCREHISLQLMPRQVLGGLFTF